MQPAQVGCTMMHNCAGSPLGHLRAYHAFCKSLAAKLIKIVDTLFPSIDVSYLSKPFLHRQAASLWICICFLLQTLHNFSSTNANAAQRCFLGMQCSVQFKLHCFRTTSGHGVISENWESKKSLKRSAYRSQLPADPPAKLETSGAPGIADEPGYADPCFCRDSAGKTWGNKKKTAWLLECSIIVCNMQSSTKSKNLQARALIAGSSGRIFWRSEEFAIISFQPC